MKALFKYLIFSILMYASVIVGVVLVNELFRASFILLGIIVIISSLGAVIFFLILSVDALNEVVEG